MERWRSRTLRCAWPILVLYAIAIVLFTSVSMKRDKFLDAIISSRFGDMPSENNDFSNFTECLLSTRLRCAQVIICKVFACRRHAKTLHIIKKKARLRTRPSEEATFEKQSASILH